MIHPIDQLPPIFALVLDSERQNALMVLGLRWNCSIRMAHDALPEELDAV